MYEECYCYVVYLSEKMGDMKKEGRGEDRMFAGHGLNGEWRMDKG